MRNTLFIWLVCIFVLTGCVTNYPKDIAVVSIKVVDRREQAELSPPPAKDSFKSKHPYRDFLLALAEAKGEEPIRPEDMAVYFQEQEVNQVFKNAKPREPLLKVEFSSQENIHQFARDNSYPVAIWPYFCNRPKEPVILGTIVFASGLDIGAPFKYEMWKDDNGLFIYYSFLNVSFTAKQPSTH